MYGIYRGRFLSQGYIPTSIWVMGSVGAGLTVVLYGIRVPLPLAVVMARIARSVAYLARL